VPPGSDVNTLFFLLEWDRYRFDKKRARTCYTELGFFLPPVGYAGDVVFILIPGREMSMHYFLPPIWI
jgi:hypothetical protein